MKKVSTLSASATRRRHSPRLAKAGTPFGTSLGFSLVEVLVAIVILSFGMLGMVGMQAFALQSNRDARLQSQAASLPFNQVVDLEGVAEDCRCMCVLEPVGFAAVDSF